MAQPTPKKAGMELMATYPQDDEGRRMCMRSKLDGKARGVRMFVDIALSGPHKGMLRLWRDPVGMKKGQDVAKNGKRKYTPGPVVLHANKGQYQVRG